MNLSKITLQRGDFGSEVFFFCIGFQMLLNIGYIIYTWQDRISNINISSMSYKLISM